MKPDSIVKIGDAINENLSLNLINQNGVHAAAVVMVDNNGDAINPGGMILGAYDYVSVAYPNDTTEVYTFKSGGSGGTTVATITIVYTSIAKEFISTVTKS